MPGDTRTAFLFQCDGEELFAVSPEKGGANIPRSSCTQGWLFRQELQFGAQDPVPAPIESETIIRGLIDRATTSAGWAGDKSGPDKPTLHRQRYGFAGRGQP